VRCMSMRRRVAVGAVAAVVAVGLVSCSSDDGNGEDVVNDDATVDTTTDGERPIVGENIQFDPNQPVNDGEPVQLEWWVWGNEDKFQALADDYSEIHPNVTITVLNQPWDDYWTKLPLELQGDSGPAVFNVHNSHQENLLPYMEPYAISAEDLAADYTGAAAHVIDGETYYIDFGFMSGAIYYNTDMWAAAGLTEADIPETWDEFRAVASELTVRDGDSLRVAGFNFNGSGQSFQGGMAYQLGQNLFEADGTTPAIDNAANLEVIERFMAMYDEDGSGDPNFGTNAGEAFGQGLAAMIYDWGYMANLLADNYPDLNFATFQTPVPVEGETPYAYDRYNGEATFGINKSATDAQKSAAQDLLRFYLTNTEFLTQTCIDYGVFPAYKPIADDPAFAESPALAAFGDLERYIWPGPMPAAIETSWRTMWEDVLYNGVDPSAALETAQAAAERGLAGTDFVSVESLFAFYQR